MRKIKQLLILLIMVSISTLVVGQPNYIEQTQSSTANFYTLQTDFYSWQTNQTSSTYVIKATKEFARFEAFWKNRVVNNSTTTGSFSEYSKAAMQEWSSSRCISGDESKWQVVGPFPNGMHNMGMIKSLWCDPNDQNFIIVGSGRNGGIFRSTDGGNTWDDVLTTQKIPALGINSFAVSPNKINNKRVIYAGTGETFSIGIIKSIDNGLTWDPIDAFPFYSNASTSLHHNYKVQKVVVPQNITSTQQDIIYAIARNSFLKSVTGGTTWSSPYSLGANVGEAVDLEVVPSDYSKVFIGTNCILHYQSSTNSNVFDYPAKLFYSSNGGTTWNDITTNIAGNVNYSSIHIAIQSNGTLYVHYSIYGGGTAIKKSTDNGLTWSSVTILAKGLSGNESFKVSTTGNIYQGDAYPWKNNTKMYDYNTTATTHCDIRAIQIIPTTGDDIIVLANDGGISKSIDEGTTWLSLNGNGQSGLVNSELHGFAVSSMHEDRILVGRQDNGTSLMFENEWKNQNIFMGDGEECLFKPNDDNYLYSVNNCEIHKGKIVNGQVINQTFSSDPGVNCYSYATTDKFLGRPIAMHKQFPDRMFAGKKGGKLNITNDDGATWTTVQLKESDGITNVNSSIIDIEISELNPNIMYIVTSKIMWSGSSNVKNAVFRSSDYGQTWTDITAGTNQSVPNNWRAVTDLTIDYVNPNKVWISMGSVDMKSNGDAEHRVFRCDNTNASNSTRNWVDITTNNISPLPVTAIVNQSGTDRVFIGTDAGVFYYENNDWHCFSKDLPISWIKDIKINKQTSELFVGTYGNGLWKSPLPCLVNSSSGANMEITSDITIQNDVNHSYDIIVKDNSTLTYTNNAMVTMGADSKIIIEPGSKLIIDNATITSGCGSYWQGIEVWGDDNLKQLPTSNQGIIEVKNGGTIRNARVAIRTMKINGDGSWDWSSNGGILRLDGAKFINNNNSIWIGSYHSPSNSAMNLSYINNCKFELNDNMLDGYTGYSFIGLYDVNRISIRGNTFINKRTDLSTEKRGVAIISYDASFSIEPLCTEVGPIGCITEKPNYFGDLNYGVVVFNSKSDVFDKIYNNTFRNVYRSILLSGTNQAEVRLNDIKVPNKDAAYYLPDNITTTESDKEPYGLYLYQSTGFTVEENHFGAVKQASAKTSNTNGIIVNNTFDNVNQLYLNDFDTLQYAITALNQNRETSSGNFKGLRFLCNNMNNCFSDIDVTSNVNINTIGVAQAQGLSYNTSTSSGYLSAENVFSWDNYKPGSDFDNNDANDIITYYHSPGQDKNQNPNSTDYWVPTYYLKVNLVDAYNYNNIELCQSKINTGGDIIIDYTELAKAFTALKSSKLTLDIWRDGGIEDLGAQVELTSDPEAYYRFNSLISQSPYLSFDVLMEAIDNPVFTALMIKLIMIANPHSSHNDAIMDALENRIPALSQSYIDEIRAEETTVSQLEQLQAHVGFDYHLYKNIADGIIHTYRIDYENSWATDSLIAFLSRMNDVNSQYELAATYLELNKYEDMDIILSSIGNRTDLTDNQIANHLQYVSFFNIAKLLRDGSLAIDELSESQRTNLISMEESQDHYFSAYALSLLKANESTYPFAEPIVHSASTASRLAPPSYNGNENTKDDFLKVYPNPSKDYITVEYSIKGQYAALNIELYDVSGKLIMQQQLINSNNDLLINLSHIQPGVYMLRLMGDGAVIDTERITIIK